MSSRFSLDFHLDPFSLPLLPVEFSLLEELQSLCDREEIVLILSWDVAVSFAGEDVAKSRGLDESVEEGGHQLDLEEIERGEVGADLEKMDGMRREKVVRLSEEWGRGEREKEGRRTLRMSSDGKSRSWIRAISGAASEEPS